MDEENKLLKILIAHGIKKDKARELLDPLKELNTKYPKLSDEEIRCIAREITDRFLKLWEPLAKHSNPETMRKRIYDVILGIAIGVVSSGIFALLTYLVGHVKFMWAPSEERDREELRRETERAWKEAEEKAKAEMPLSPSVREKLKEEISTLYLLSQSFGMDLEKKIRQEKIIQEFVEVVKNKGGHKFEERCYDSLGGLIYGLLISNARQKLVG